MEHGVERLATAATILRKELCSPGAMTLRWVPPTHYTLRRIIASVMKHLICSRNYISPTPGLSQMALEEIERVVAGSDCSVAGYFTLDEMKS